ncbi:MFS transporter [Fictibacillus enclensis]|uniref:MFS transporter n=1 Tax=Fictibacillus enclensis TaxID=1017270 RepID=UPI0025A2EECA|nr:MFS transporter [Fictibacillus enclensis]MDM5337120.1 MFS transporter [Fictibacillus enclensis]
MTYKQLLRSQSVIMTASSVAFPFYLLLLRNLGDSYSQFGWAYGLFALSSALFHPLIGRWSDRFGDRIFLLVYAWGMALVMLMVPVLSETWQVYVIQVIMGLLGAVQKTTEKTALSRQTEQNHSGKKVGHYHLWTSIWAGLAVILTGYLIDFLTIGALFYVTSFLYFIGGVILWTKSDLEDGNKHMNQKAV